MPHVNYLSQRIDLYESDFSHDKSLKFSRTLEFMQNLATEHVEQMGCGWDFLNEHDMLWVLSKTKMRFYKKITKKTGSIVLTTWPLAPNKVFCERLFEARSASGELLFSAVTIWIVINKTTRKILPTAKVERYVNASFDDCRSELDDKFDKVVYSQDFEPKYTFLAMQSHLDVNKHVNNTHYVTFAQDAYPCQSFNYAEIVYSKELKLDDKVTVCGKQGERGEVLVVGVRDGEQCFSVKLTNL